MRKLYSKKHPFATEENLEKLVSKEEFEKLENSRKKIINLGNTHFHPTPSLLNELNMVLVFNENTKKRDIPSGSLWVYETKEYKPEILKDDVGCGISIFLLEKGVGKTDFLEVAQTYSIGGGNHFLNYSTYNSEFESIVLHTDMNKDKKTPKTVSEAIDMQDSASRQRQEIGENIIRDLGIKGRILYDIPHNTVELKEDKTIYKKGITDSKKNKGINYIALTPHLGIAELVQDPNAFNGYFQHGLGVKNHDFKKYFNKHKSNPNTTFYIPNENNSKINESFNELNNFKNLSSAGIYIIKQLKPNISIKMR